ncbi:unnamed protein product [Cunninghamella blakesleeana]
MIQTTLFNYFTCNGLTRQSVNRVYLFKQTNLQDYYNITTRKKKSIKPKKGSILNYFKPKQDEQKEKKVYDLVLVDINKSHTNYINCVKKNMYDPSLKYICISYRWGELNEQLVETPDYTAHITSFDLWHLGYLCETIKRDPGLKRIPYLWIDAISVDQENHARKKDTILKMNQIYQNASFILAVPDLHKEYLCKNTANQAILNLLLWKYRYTIYNIIFNNADSFIDHSTHSTQLQLQEQEQQTNKNQYSNLQYLTSNKLINEIEQLKMEMKEKEIENKLNQVKDELKKIYEFLAYLIDDWSNRAWVISEYHIAKEKYMKYGTPLKYWFISLEYYKPIFSYHFDNDNDDNDRQHRSTINNKNDDDDDDDDDDRYNKRLTYKDVNDAKTFHQFIKSRFMQRSHLEMILNSNATRNEDRFHAILPSWNEYHHLIINRNTIPEWNITDMTSVRLKLYSIMNLWDKATLLYACSGNTDIILPSFANFHNVYSLRIVEKSDYNHVEYKEFEEGILNYIRTFIKEEEKAIQMKQLINEYKINSKPIWIENLTSIQLEQQQCYLSVHSNSYFIKTEILSDEHYNYVRSLIPNKLSLNGDDDEIHRVSIPFFTFTDLLDYMDYPPVYRHSSTIHLIANP